jgi:ABC-type Fe3+ transport system permease subunit
MHKPVMLGYRTLELSTYQKLSIPFAQPCPEIPSIRRLTKCLLIVLLVLVVATARASLQRRDFLAIDPSSSRSADPKTLECP